MRENKAQGSKKEIRMATFSSSYLKMLLNDLIYPTFVLDMGHMHCSDTAVGVNGNGLGN